MTYKKFLIVPVMLVLYLILWPLLLPIIPTQHHVGPPESLENYGNNGLVERIGVGDSITVEIRRPYFFGLIELPVYINGKDIGFMHDTFFSLILIILILMLVYELHIKEVEENGGLEGSREGGS